MTTNPFWPPLAPDLFGDLVTGGDVRDAVKATIQLWHPTYVAEINSRKGLSLLDFEDFDVRPEFRTLASNNSPACMVTCRGTSGKPRRGGDGTIGVPWTVEVDIVAWLPSWEDAEDAIGCYATAVVALLLQHPGLGGVADGLDWLSYRYSIGGHESTRTLGLGVLLFEVNTPQALRAAGGPATPGDPTTAPPTVTSTHISIEERP